MLGFTTYTIIARVKPLKPNDRPTIASFLTSEGYPTGIIG